MRTRLSLLALALGCAGAALLFGAGQSASAAPVLSVRITGVTAAVGGTTVNVEIKAKCASGYENDSRPNLLIVKEELASGWVTASDNFTGTELHWPCDGADHLLSVDLVADGPWQAGTLKATFDAEAGVPGVLNPFFSDSAKKSLRLR